MQIRIKKDASSLARAYNVTPDYWSPMLDMLEGRFLEIDTTYLFNDQFNTMEMPETKIEELITEFRKSDLFKDRRYCKNYFEDMLPKVRRALKMGLRVHLYLVSEILEDQREIKIPV